MKSFLKTELNIKKQVIFTDGLIGGGKTLISNLVSGLKMLNSGCSRLILREFVNITLLIRST